MESSLQYLYRTNMTRQFTTILGLFLCLSQAAAFSLSMSSAAVGAGKTAVIAGATGYIGKSVVRDSVRQGYKTIALVRDKSKVNSPEGQLSFGQFFEGAEVVECDVTNPEQLTKVRSSSSSSSSISSSIMNRESRGNEKIIEATKEWGQRLEPNQTFEIDFGFGSERYRFYETFVQ